MRVPPGDQSAAGLLSGGPRPVPFRDAIAVSHRPVLIIADGPVPDEPAAAQWFQAASPATVRAWVGQHAGHTAALATRPRVWDEQVTSFLAAALEPTRCGGRSGPLGGELRRWQVAPVMSGLSAARAGRPALP